MTSEASGDVRPVRPARVVAFVVMWVVVALVLVSLRSPPSGGDGRSLVDALDATWAVVAAIVGAMCVGLFRWSGDSAALWLGTGFLVFSAGRLVPLVVMPLLDPTLATTDVTAVVRLAARVGAVAAFIVALARSEMDRPGLRRIVAVVALAVVSSVLMFRVAGIDLFPERADITRMTRVQVAAAAALAGAWLALAVVSLRAAAARRRTLLAWLGAGFLMLAAAQVAALPDTLVLSGAELPVPVLRIAGFACALVGVVGELGRLYATQGRRLFEASLLTARAAAQANDARRVLEERAHEARNALHAIAIAARTLRRHRDSLDPADREEISRVLEDQIDGLSRLIEPPKQRPPVGRFPLAEALASAVSRAHIEGSWPTVDIPEGLVVFGVQEETEGVLENLVGNALRHAPGPGLEIRAERREGEVVVRVLDRGPGVARSEREAIFERGVRGAASEGVPGSGLGLSIAAALVRAQGGTIWVEERPGGGASFAFTLPEAAEAIAVDSMTEESR